MQGIKTKIEGVHKENVTFFMKLFDNDDSDTLRLADEIVEDKTVALRAATEKEKSLREEYLKIKIKNDKLMTKQS